MSTTPKYRNPYNAAAANTLWMTPKQLRAQLFLAILVVDRRYFVPPFWPGGFAQVVVGYVLADAMNQ